MFHRYTFRPILVVLPVLAVFFLLTTCNKKPVGEITVTTKEITNITGNSATTGGTVISSGYTVGECGVCYSEYSYPSIENVCTKDQEGDGSFNSSLSNLKPGTTYYVRAYAKSSSGIEYGDNVVFTTTSNNTINVFANPTAGGTVTGAGAYQLGQSCTVTATAKTGYTFTDWTENGTTVSTNENYTFTVTGSRNLQANFKMDTFTITVSAEPSVGGGTVSGGGEYGYGKSCTVTATPYYLSTFQNWTENGEVVSTNKSYTFTVTSDRNLVANFSILSFSVTVSAYPSEGGTVSGGGSGFSLYDECTVKAVANPGYSFYYWSEDNTVVSYDAEYTFNLEGDRNLVANFIFIENYPTVTTSDVTNITQSSATCGGNVTNDGGSTVFERGLCWSTSPNPTIENDSYTVLGSGTGAFSGQINGLYQNTYYYVRAFATNNAGTGYGEEKTFMTNSPEQDDTWLYYDNNELYSSWGYIEGGSIQWAVMFPSYILEPYKNMKIYDIKVHVGVAGTYHAYFYTGEATPATLIKSYSFTLGSSGWWTISLDSPVNITAKNLWVAIKTDHEAGTYPASCSAGSNNPNARWIKWDSHGWCDAYLEGWCNIDITWMIRVFATNEEKGQRTEITTQEIPTPHGEQRSTKQKRVFQRSR